MLLKSVNRVSVRTDIWHHFVCASVIYCCKTSQFSKGVQGGGSFTVFSNLLLKHSFLWQELCSKYRSQVRNGRLPCTRKNDPIEGLDGKIHENTCFMCETFLWVQLQPVLLSVKCMGGIASLVQDIDKTFLSLWWVWGMYYQDTQWQPFLSTASVFWRMLKLALWSVHVLITDFPRVDDVKVLDLDFSIMSGRHHD